MDAVFKMENMIFNYRVVGVWIENGHVLLHKQVKGEHWALPGGRVQVMEDSKTALKREIKEELGQSVIVHDLLWITENFFEYNHIPFHEIGLYYRISSEDNNPFYRNESFFGLEGDRLIYEWFPINELEKIGLYPEFLKTSMKDIPTSPKHLIITQN
ncbi:NUDIX hydrolase [Ferdinandcohnia quinoae]|uniref:NUDIX hydrolase n=1 Tax=Fredinandcohnia quinoae TaxID=2918902 RepID=A0AAW5E5C0_9BACI|nr:NUDIX hydrolase [Fredinandcohnia sp. SECRCQ15]MCH1624303.1 NUDIX hydrolase [Fredinandcohnia sp. SECRCQ15]